jgi:arsenate reductase
MSQIELYGLPSCDTVRKARQWLDAQGVAHSFQAFAKTPDLADRLPDWAARTGMARLLNTNARNFKALPEAEQARLLADQGAALAAMAQTPQLIKRPVLVTPDLVLTGFDAHAWQQALGL